MRSRAYLLDCSTNRVLRPPQKAASGPVVYRVPARPCSIGAVLVGAAPAISALSRNRVTRKIAKAL